MRFSSDRRCCCSTTRSWIFLNLFFPCAIFKALFAEFFSSSSLEVYSTKSVIIVTNSPHITATSARTQNRKLQRNTSTPSTSDSHTSDSHPSSAHDSTSLPLPTIIIMSTPSEEAAATLIALPTNNCARCMLFLKLADIPPTEIQIKSPADYGGLRSAEYQKINPQAKFPAYISKDQNFALFEAQVILDYLADAWAGAPRGASASGASASQLSQYHDPQQRALSRLMIQVHDIYLSSPNCTAKGFFGTQGVLYRADMGVAERKSRMGEMQKQLDVLEGLCKQARAAEGNEDCGRRDGRSVFFRGGVFFEGVRMHLEFSECDESGVGVRC